LHVHDFGPRILHTCRCVVSAADLQALHLALAVCAYYGIVIVTV